ncbi:MAG TPA: 1,2-phenylacetyl-CoA epoxidase subunit PaaD [Steroidobacteraceae bacterium]|nr:1,2-phenylacetyl-CoA epoxidase subunit PaaD [Steroidobacteraceae bacterium]
MHAEAELAQGPACSDGRDVQPDATPRESAIWRALASVADPEIPVLSILDLGIVRYVHWRDTPGPHVGITPTYSGCPATELIRTAVHDRLAAEGYANVTIEQVLAPPWSTDWLTSAARAKLAAFGIAPPASAAERARGAVPVLCPRCGSSATRRVSEFGSTPCKAHYSCRDCLEPFDHFKCL